MPAPRSPQPSGVAHGRSDQGLPTTITDADVLRRVARLIRQVGAKPEQQR